MGCFLVALLYDSGSRSEQECGRSACVALLQHGAELLLMDLIWVGVQPRTARCDLYVWEWREEGGSV